jgi:molybdenum cofactor cytidylyltransferase
MGGPKQLLASGGRTLLAHTLACAADAGAEPIAVVLGAHSAAILSQVGLDTALVVMNPDWSSGMASSIRLGIGALTAADPSLDAVLVTPCDQPGLSPGAILRLAGLHRSTGLIAAARYNGRLGAPAVFGSAAFALLASLKGDEGARWILNSGTARVASADLPEFGFDIDTPEDYRAWASRQA